MGLPGADTCQPQNRTSVRAMAPRPIPAAAAATAAGAAAAPAVAAMTWCSCRACPGGRVASKVTCVHCAASGVAVAVAVATPAAATVVVAASLMAAVATAAAAATLGRVARRTPLQATRGLDSALMMAAAMTSVEARAAAEQPRPAEQRPASIGGACRLNQGNTVCRMKWLTTGIGAAFGAISGVARAAKGMPAATEGPSAVVLSCMRIAQGVKGTVKAHPAIKAGGSCLSSCRPAANTTSLRSFRIEEKSLAGVSGVWAVLSA
ncbi:hypothetical protein DUNSADRAFT_15755 [Dunaliella salina]|uniref:Encoded protein n=1 Tax=Dunaliella salina TaxID=3046 RepID=A0ABQ7H9C8_DUNSA|nr:hypothetical protein DUNSADRAFT_15755 [Dunaliella salina]|eukprot:KAF5843460.1 hypothetical protein DUNSADRAFT_15755 [Dunaliella salina]